MRTGAVVVSWNGTRYLEACLRSLCAQTLPFDAVIVVDNASDDGSCELLRQFAASTRHPQISVIPQERNLGFTRGANLGMTTLLEQMDPMEVVALVNQDAELDPNWNAQVLATFDAAPRRGAVGSRILYPNRQTVQHAGGYLEQARFAGQHFGHHTSAARQEFESRDVEFVTAAAMALRAAALRDVGLFDEIYSPGYYEDVDLCERLRNAGWQVHYCQSAVATHAESTAFANPAARLRLSERNRLIYALRKIAEPETRRRFFDAEYRHVSRSSPPERRAIASACLSVLVRIEELAAARVPGGMNSGTVSELIACLVELRARALN